MQRFKLSAPFMLAVIALTCLVPLIAGAITPMTPQVLGYSILGSAAVVAVASLFVQPAQVRYTRAHFQFGDVGEDEIRQQYKQVQKDLKEVNDSLKKHAENAEKEKTFLAENGKKDGVKTTESGLQYVVLTEGSGEKPKATDTVKVHYTGTFTDGKTFDSSVERGEPAEFVVEEVIPGWVEALQLMPVGSKYKLFIPSALAYGEEGAGGVIPPFSTLVFEVELLSIEKAK